MALALSSARRPRRRPFFRGSKQPTEWVAGYMSSSVAPASNIDGVDLISNAEIREMTGPLFLGGYLDLQVQAYTLETGIPSVGVVAFGLHVLPERTFQAGPTAWPLPFSDAEGDWPFHRFVTMLGQSLDGTTPASEFNPANFVRESHRIRSRRRLGEDDVIVLVAELLTSGPITPSGSICFQVGYRLLLRQK